MNSKNYFAGLICILIFTNGCKSENTELWQALPDTQEEPVSVGIDTIVRHGDIATMQTKILFPIRSPSNKKRKDAHKPLLSHVIAEYRYNCKLRTVELIKAVEHFSSDGNNVTPQAVATEYPPNTAQITPKSSLEDAFNIACK